MYLPYIIAGSRISAEATQAMPAQIRGWPVIEFEPDILEELSEHRGPGIGINVQRLALLQRDPQILRLSFMNNDPDDCVGYITDTEFTNDRAPEDSEQAHRGRFLAQSLITGYVTNRSAYLGHWACVAKRWVNLREGRTWK